METGCRRPGFARHLALGFGLALLVVGGLAGCNGWSPTGGSGVSGPDVICPDCPPCGPGGSCSGDFCRPTTCARGRCVPDPGPCNDSDPHTWDRCDASRASCSAYLTDGSRSCAAVSDCTTGQPCQEFHCVEGLCQLTDATRFCGDAFLRPVVCASRDECVRHELWMLSHPEKALVTLAGGPWCVTQADGGSFCQWVESPHVSQGP